MYIFGEPGLIVHNMQYKSFVILDNNNQWCSCCQAKVQVQVQSSKIKKSRTWTFLTLLSTLHHTSSCAMCHPTILPPVPPTINFSGTSRGPTTECYTFLETSHDPWLRYQLRCKKFAIFLQPYFAKIKVRVQSQVNWNISDVSAI